MHKHLKGLFNRGRNERQSRWPSGFGPERPAKTSLIGWKNGGTELKTARLGGGSKRNGRERQRLVSSKRTKV